VSWWTDIEVCGKRAAFWDIGTKRLYVCEKAGAFEAWDGNRKVGVYVNLDDAKAAAEGRRVAKPEPKPIRKFSSFKFVMDEPKVKPAEPVERSFEELPKSSPYKFVAPETAAPAKPLTVPSIYKEIGSGFCSCGTKLGRRGKCPALCEAVCA
jgi:hypothetical protein